MLESLRFDHLIDRFHGMLEDLPDHRTGKNTQYSMKDAALGAFGVFFTQTPSFLAYQRDMERRKGESNAHTLLGMAQIPSDNQIRNLLDPINPSHFFGMFTFIFEVFRQTTLSRDYQTLGEEWLISLDGTQHFSSTKIHCPNCYQTEQEDGTTRYSHQVLSAILVSPDHDRVLSLPPEFIHPQEGHDLSAKAQAGRQDCEQEAAKRWIKEYASLFEGQDQGVTLLGDALHTDQPTCELALEQGYDFIFVCKPGSHPHLYEKWIDVLDGLEDGLSTSTERRWNGQFHEIWSYRYVNQVPIRSGEDALRVNWVELTITHARTDEQLYRCAFITNHLLSEENFREIVSAGRARWKNENEHNNVLKNRGYHLEHNFGHGQQHLSNVLVTLNLLAFLFHTLFALFDDTYQQVRQELGTRRTFFNDIRTLTRYRLFNSWEHLLDFMFEGLEIAPT